jgi:adenosylhomocysteinase
MRKTDMEPLMRLTSANVMSAGEGQNDGSSADLPALNSLLKTVPTQHRPRSILVTHILETAVPYVEAVNGVFPVAGIVAVPYSVSLSAVETLRAKGFMVSVPASIPETFQIAETQILKALADSQHPLIVQDGGGYVADAAQRLSKYPHFAGIVENTNNGFWRYEQTGPHRVPILSRAQSSLKFAEDTIIGDAVVYSIERILREEFAAIAQGLRCAVIGFGKIGRSTAVALRGREAVVSIYDINPIKNMSAKVEGFFPIPLKELLPQSDLIVGCTGQTSIRGIDMEHIKDGAILVSASSKDTEFALQDFAKACEVWKMSDIIWRFTQPNGSRFYVLAQGTPINFRDASILGTILDMIYCELFVCMREVASGRAPIGLTVTAPSVENEVGQAWLLAHSEEFRRNADDKVWSYPESLSLGLPR